MVKLRSSVSVAGFRNLRPFGDISNTTFLPASARMVIVVRAESAPLGTVNTAPILSIEIVPPCGPIVACEERLVLRWSVQRNTLTLCP